ESVRLDQMLLERGDRRKRLEGRARRRCAVDGANDGRVVVDESGLRGAEAVRIEPPAGAATGPDRGVVRGRRGEGEDRAVLGVQRDDGTAVGGPEAVVVSELDAVLERVLGGTLQMAVDREADRLPG